MSDTGTTAGAPVQDGHGVLGMVGYFTDPDALRIGMERVAKSDAREPLAYTSIPDIPALEAFHPASSPARWVALAGGLTGIATALAMTIWMSWDYPLVVGGKPITSIPPFMVVAFELMVLFGSIGALLGFLWFARLPDLTPSAAYRPPMGVDEWAIYVPCEDERECARAERILREAGATDVATVHDRERGRLQVLR